MNTTIPAIAVVINAGSRRSIFGYQHTDCDNPLFVFFWHGTFYVYFFSVFLVIYIEITNELQMRCVIYFYSFVYVYNSQYNISRGANDRDLPLEVTLATSFVTAAATGIRVGPDSPIPKLGPSWLARTRIVGDSEC